MLCADGGVDWVGMVSNQGLAVALVVAFMFGFWRVVQVGAPLVRQFVESTVDLHTSLKETTIRQTALMDDIATKLADHGGKLSDIKNQLASNRCLAAEMNGSASGIHR